MNTDVRTNPHATAATPTTDPRDAARRTDRPAVTARDPRQTDRKSLVCHACGCGHFRVIYTRPTWGGRIMRRRECRHCGKRVTTWERSG